MVKKVYNECKSLVDNHNQKNWAWEVKSILAKCGLYTLGGTRVHVMDSHTEWQNIRTENRSKSAQISAGPPERGNSPIAN